MEMFTNEWTCLHVNLLPALGSHIFSRSGKECQCAQSDVGH